MDLGRMLDKCVRDQWSIDDLDWSIPPPAMTRDKEEMIVQAFLDMAGIERLAGALFEVQREKTEDPTLKKIFTTFDPDEKRHAAVAARLAEHYNVHKYRTYTESEALTRFRPHFLALVRNTSPEIANAYITSGELILDVALLRSLDDYVADEMSHAAMHLINRDESRHIAIDFHMTEHYCSDEHLAEVRKRSVISGGFGEENKTNQTGATPIEGEVVAISSEALAEELKASKKVVIGPGNGMAVAQAQHATFQLTQILRNKNIEVRFAIHPVAGRMPGHMNVLLAEAKVPYDIVFEMEEINDDFPETDIMIVIGANDIVNPAALEDPHSPIAGMPVLEVWKAKRTVVLKRSMAAGYAGIENALFYKENNRMLFGDAKTKLEEILKQLGQ